MSQFRPKAAAGAPKERARSEQFRPNFSNVFRRDPRDIQAEKQAELDAVKFAQSRVGKCSAENKSGEPCGAKKAKGTDYCVGHLRQLGLLNKDKEVADDSGRADSSGSSAD